jgi:hypothetical protein
LIKELKASFVLVRKEFGSSICPVAILRRGETIGEIGEEEMERGLSTTPSNC